MKGYGYENCRALRKAGNFDTLSGFTTNAL